jgi:hypothetical protein
LKKNYTISNHATEISAFVLRKEKGSGALIKKYSFQNVWRITLQNMPNTYVYIGEKYSWTGKLLGRFQIIADNKDELINWLGRNYLTG